MSSEPKTRSTRYRPRILRDQDGLWPSLQRDKRRASAVDPLFRGSSARLPGLEVGGVHPEQLADPGDDLGAVEPDRLHPELVREAAHGVLQLEPREPQRTHRPGDLL